MAEFYEPQVGDIVREHDDGPLLRVAALYDGCDEVVVEEVDEPDSCWDALGFQLQFVRRGDG
ncbi:MAG: hypothetical protein KIS90_00690 [Phenylobacterium sp.]|nr:hypothetical protein [Phenylobacterium sp.]